MAYDLDAIIRRQLYLQRYANGYANSIVDLLKSGDKKTINLIRNFFDDASEKDIAALLKSNKNNSAVREFINSLTDITKSQKLAVSEFAQLEMLELAESEVNYTYKALGSTAVARPAASTILSSPILGSSDISENWNVLINNSAIKTFHSVKNAAQDNLDAVQIIKGTKEQNYKDGVLTVRNNGISSLANTQAVGVSGNARSESYKRFQFKQVVFNATLDFRTTSQCRSLDGKVFEKGEEPHTPLHYRCRTVLLPWIGEYSERPYVESSKSIGKMTKKERAELESGITTDTYQQFFERQTEAHKREILGSGRYDLYKENNLDMDDFYNDKTGKQYTLTELNSLY